MKKVIILGDILENYRDGRRQTIPRHLQDALALSHILKPCFNYAGDFDCELLNWNETDELRKYIYNYCLNSIGDSYKDWLHVQNLPPTKEIVDCFRYKFSQNLVIGFHLPSILKQALNTAGITWIHLEVTAPGFLKDLVFKIYSNNSRVMTVAKLYSLPEEQIVFSAAQLKASYSQQHTDPGYWLYPNSILLIAPTYLSSPHINQQGELRTLLEFKSDIQKILSKHRQIYVFSQYTNDFSPLEHDFLHNELNACYIKEPSFISEMCNAYLLITHPAITRVIGFDSNLLADAKYLGKKTLTFDKKVSDGILLKSNWLTPQFWKKILHSLNFPTNDKCIKLKNLPYMRLLFHGSDGFFDDNTSSYTSSKEYETYLIQQQLTIASDLLGSNINSEYSNNLPKRNVKIVQYPFAIIAAGDKNILIPAIVAIKSYGLHLGNSNLFYICPKSDYSKDLKNILEAYGITLISSDAHVSFSSAFRTKSSASYLQFAGSEELSKLKFNYSLSIQPDMLCLKSFDTDMIFKRTKYIAAPINNISRLSKSLKIASVGLPYHKEWNELDSPGFIPSILFCNHSGLSKIDFMNKAKQYFDEFGARNLPLNEENILHVFQFRHPDFCHVIDESYSYIPTRNSFLHPLALHFDTNAKPWKPIPYWRWLARVGVLYEVWHKAALKILGSDTYRNFINSLPHKNKIYGIQNI